MTFAELVLTVCLGASPELADTIESQANRYNVDPELVLAQIYVESKCNTNAVGAGNAQGLMQIIPKWHENRMARLQVNNLFSPRQNILVGLDYLSTLIAAHGLHAALARYNGGNNPPAASQTYAENVISRYTTYLDVTNHQDYVDTGNSVP